jgi:S1-C subfamily serine protease
MMRHGPDTADRVVAGGRSMTIAGIARTLLVAAALLAAGAGAPTQIARAAAAPALTPAQIAETAIPSVVLIKVPNGLGSGFVVSTDGRIVTNFHVIRGAREATIVTADGREFHDIELLATDEAHDLAVLRIGTHGLKPLPLGDSAAAKPGEHVVAIGHPLGLGDTVSDGLVSGIRELPSTKQTMLQISAPISPGSSGGPVFNDRGEVIGVSALLITGGENLNFAVPINEAKPLLANNKGVALAALPPDVAAPGPYAAAGTPHLPHQMQHYAPSVLQQCGTAELSGIAGSLNMAINSGAPLYNAGNPEGCYLVYAGIIGEIDRRTNGCPAAKQALRQSLSVADAQSNPQDKAWALRNAFDGLIDAILRRQSGGS